MSKCQGIMGAIFGHKFSPRYSKGSANISSVKGGYPDDTIRLVEALKPTTYHYDICERCGVIVEKHNKLEA